MDNKEIANSIVKDVFGGTAPGLSKTSNSNQNIVHRNAQPPPNTWQLFLKAYMPFIKANNTDLGGMKPMQFIATRYQELKQNGVDIGEYILQLTDPTNRQGNTRETISTLILDSLDKFKSVAQSLKERQRTTDPDDEEKYVKLLEDTQDTITAAISDIINKSQLKDEKSKEALKKALEKYLLPKLQQMTGNVVFEHELHRIAPAVIYQPGSPWIKTVAREQFSNEPREKYRDVLRDIRRGKRSLNQEWRALCSQIDDSNKAQLLEIAYELDLFPHVKAKMTKAEICDFLKKYYAVTFAGQI